MKTSLIIKMVLAFGLLSTLLTLTVTRADTWKGRVVSVTDGDTITVKHGDNHESLRLCGIDAPEIMQPFGQEAYRFVFDRVNMRTVEVKPSDYDNRYRHTIAWIYYWDGENRKCLNEELLKAGLAWYYKQFSNEQYLADLEKEARIKKVGLWADPIPPWEFRAGNTGISELHGNTVSKTYHRANCKHYNCRHCTEIIKSNEEALAAGYKPCGWCKP